MVVSDARRAVNDAEITAPVSRRRVYWARSNGIAAPRPGVPTVYPRGGPSNDTGAIADQEAHSWKSSVSVSTDEMTEARKEPIVFVELDTRQDAGFTVSLEWNRDAGNTRIVVADSRDQSLLVFCVPGANAGDAFRHPFRYAP
jgi:hypothetical protein